MPIDDATTDLMRSLQVERDQLRQEIEQLRAAARTSQPSPRADPKETRASMAARAPVNGTRSAAAPGDIAAIVEAVLDRLRSEPELLSVRCRDKTIAVNVEPVRVEIDGSTLRGRICRLIVAGFMDEPRTGNTVFNELKRAGARIAKPNVYRECKQLAEWGFLTIENGGGYAAVPQMKRHISEAD